MIGELFKSGQEETSNSRIVRHGAGVEQFLILIVEEASLGQMIEIEIFEVVDTLQEIFDKLFARLKIAHVMLLHVANLIHQFCQIPFVWIHFTLNIEFQNLNIKKKATTKTTTKKNIILL